MMLPEMGSLITDIKIASQNRVEQLYITNQTNRAKRANISNCYIQ